MKNIACLAVLMMSTAAAFGEPPPSLEQAPPAPFFARIISDSDAEINYVEMNPAGDRMVLMKRSAGRVDDVVSIETLTLEGAAWKNRVILQRRQSPAAEDTFQPVGLSNDGKYLIFAAQDDWSFGANSQWRIFALDVDGSQRPLELGRWLARGERMTRQEARIAAQASFEGDPWHEDGAREKAFTLDDLRADNRHRCGENPNRVTISLNTEFGDTLRFAMRDAAAAYPLKDLFGAKHDVRKTMDLPVYSDGCSWGAVVLSDFSGPRGVPSPSSLVIFGAAPMPQP